MVDYHLQAPLSHRVWTVTLYICRAPLLITSWWVQAVEWEVSQA